MLQRASVSLKETLLGVSPVEPEDEEEVEGRPAARLAGPPSLALHRAAFCNDLETLHGLLANLSEGDTEARDAHGNTALHVAVLRRNLAAIEALLAAGASPEAKNAAKWTPLDEAIALRDKEATKALLAQLRLEVKRLRKSMKPRIVAAMQQGMQDFTIKMRWELGSPLFGLLLKRYAPDDTYTVYKVGARLRVDGMLRGLDPHSHSLLPRWKRAPFSLLVDASKTPVAAALVDHDDRTWVDLYRERKKAVRDLDTDAEEIIAAGAGRVRLKGGEIRFEEERSWLGWLVPPKVEGHRAEVYDISGQMVAVVLKKAAVVVPPGSTFEQYLAMRMPTDQREEVPWDPLTSPPPSVARTFAPDAAVAAELAAGSGRAVAAVAAGAAARLGGHGRYVSGRIWVAHNYPLSLRQLLPLLEAMGSANKHVAAAAQVIAQYEDQTAFPLKLQVPLMWTVHLLLRFRGYAELRPGGDHPALAPGFFEVPPGYQLQELAELLPAEEADAEETFYDARQD